MWLLGSSTLAKQMKQYIFCDLVDYIHVNNSKVQLLDCFSQSSHQPHYIKLVHKRFSTKNIDLKKSINSDAIPEFKEDITCMLHFRKSAFL